MPRFLPNLNALRAFEAAARHQSFTRAAEELNVTQGAVSHHVKMLETDLGVRLFQREHQGLTITAAGQTYQEIVSTAFDQLAGGTERLLNREKAGTLAVSVSPNFVAKWLVFRLGRFTDAHPAIDLRVNSTARHIDFGRDGVDLAVRHGTGAWPDLHVTKLCDEEIFPVCSPKLRDGPAPLRSVEDLRDHMILLDATRQDWPTWLAAAGMPSFVPAHSLTFDQTSTTIDAAIAGQGVALARSALCAADLHAGRLVRPFPVSVKAPFAYYIVSPKPTALRPKIVAFREWLLAEAARDVREMAEGA